MGDIDVGIVPLNSGSLGPFGRCRVFEDLDEAGRAEHMWFDNFYFVMGYPASRSQSDTNHRRQKIHVKSFHLATNPPPGDPYQKEKLSRAEHLLVEFNHKATVVERKRVVPPKLQGVSGGGIFCISRSSNRGPLVAIADRASQAFVHTCWNASAVFRADCARTLPHGASGDFRIAHDVREPFELRAPDLSRNGHRGNRLRTSGFLFLGQERQSIVDRNGTALPFGVINSRSQRISVVPSNVCGFLRYWQTRNPRVSDSRRHGSGIRQQRTSLPQTLRSSMSQS